MTPAPDRVIALTTPPFIGLMLQHALRGTRARHGHWLMDLYPHVLVAHGLLRSGGWMHRRLMAWTNRQWAGSDWIALPDRGMESRVREGVGGPGGTGIVRIPLWAPGHLEPWPETAANPIRAKRGWAEDETVFLYSGNLGRGHDVRPFLEVARACSATPRLRWIFTGDRKRLARVARFAHAHPEARIECLPYVEEDELRAHLCSADVHLVSLRESWSGLIMPSKLQAAFAVERPVLLVGPPDSDPARRVAESGGGWVVGPGDPAGLRAAVTRALSRDERRQRGQAAYRYSREEFDQARNCAKLIELVERNA